MFNGILFNADNGESFDALMTASLNAFDWLSHELLIAKFKAHSFDKYSSKPIYI